MRREDSLSNPTDANAYEDEMISITLKRWQWQDIINSVRRYSDSLSGESDYSEQMDDVPWFREIGEMAELLRDYIQSTQRESDGAG